MVRAVFLFAAQFPLTKNGTNEEPEARVLGRITRG